MKGVRGMKKNDETTIKIENIDELKLLVEQFKTTVDKLKNFEFKITVTQCEHN